MIMNMNNGNIHVSIKKSSPLRIDIFVTDKLSDYYQKFMKIFRTLSLDNRGQSGGGGCYGSIHFVFVVSHIGGGKTIHDAESSSDIGHKSYCISVSTGTSSANLQPQANFNNNHDVTIL